MFKKLLIKSGLYIDKNEHNIIEKEISEMINELKILSDFKPKYDKISHISSFFSDLRDDEIKPSSKTSDILSNSKSKNNIGFLVNKIIWQLRNILW